MGMYHKNRFVGPGYKRHIKMHFSGNEKGSEEKLQRGIYG